MAAKKRSSITESTKSAKRQKNLSPSVSDDLISIDKIKSLQAQFNESSKHLNNIAELVKQYDIVISRYASGLRSEDLDLISRFLSLTMYKMFERLISNNEFKLTKKDTDQKKTIVKWLKSKYDQFKTKLFEIWRINLDYEGLYSLKMDALDVLMKLIKIESDYLGPNVKESFFANTSFREILKNLLLTGSLKDIQTIDATIDNFLVLEFQETYYNKYWDIKYFFFSELKVILEDLDSENTQQLFFSNALTLLKPSVPYDIKNVEESTSETFTNNPPSKTISNMTTFRANFEKSWLGLMNLSLSTAQYKAILLILHKRIVPFCNNPTKLMDFLTDSYDLGFSSKDISISILALNGLWELMKNFNLEYPDFYTKLYAILTPELLHLSYKSRFLRLLDIFMSSTHLSAAIVASFIKRLARLSLTAPPSGIVCIIPFIYNLLKRHPTCMLLIHSTTTAEQDKDFVDPFNEKEVDPSKTEAINSSIWELETMTQHYHPNVASLAKIFTQQFNKYSYNIEDFLDWSYPKLLDSELSKKFKGELSIEFEQWDGLLGENRYLKDYSF